MTLYENYLYLTSPFVVELPKVSFSMAVYLSSELEAW